jgi:hypothetical protein
MFSLEKLREPPSILIKFKKRINNSGAKHKEKS